MILRLYNKVRLQWLQVGDKVEIEVYGNTFHSFNDIPFVELVHRCEGEVTIQGTIQLIEKLKPIVNEIKAIDRGDLRQSLYHFSKEDTLLKNDGVILGCDEFRN